MLRIGFPSSAKFNKKKAEAAVNVERMTEAITVIIGTPMRPVYELIEEEEAPAAEPEGSAAMSEEEMVDLIKDNFDASEVASDDTRESEAG